jgi:hypothetical protein
MVRAQNSRSLAPQVRAMVVDITNNLVKEGYRRDTALLIAIGAAETWANSQVRSINTYNYHVTPHPGGWVVRQPNSTNPCLVFKTKEEAVEIGRELAQDLGGNLIIHKDSGEIQSQMAYQ